MKRQVVMYPFCAQMLPYVRHFNVCQSGYALKGLISPLGFALAGKDAAYACNCDDIGMIVSANLSEIDKPWDSLLIVQMEDDVIVDDALFLEQLVESAIRLGKSIIWQGVCAEDAPKVIHVAKQKYPSKVLLQIKLPIDNTNGGHTQRSSFSAPIVMVGGFILEADVTEVLIGLANKFTDEGFQPLVISRQPVGELVGFRYIYDIFQDKTLSEATKITLLNKSMLKLEHDFAPDIILIEAPDSLMQHNNRFPNGYGIQSIMLSKAIPPDYLIGCAPLNLCDAKSLESLSKYLEPFFGVPIAATHISNALIDSIATDANQRMSVLRLNMGYVRESIVNNKDESSIPIFNIMDDGVNEIYALLSEELFL